MTTSPDTSTDAAPPLPSAPECPSATSALKLMLAHGEEIDVYPHLWEGARVSIKHGPLKGAIGILTRKHDKHVFVVNVEILGRSIGTKIDADELELV